METKRLVIGTLVGATVLSATGFLIFGVILPDFYTGFMNAGSASGVARQPILWWAVALAMLSYGLLIALAIGTRATTVSAARGATTGALVSFLVWFTGDFMLYGISNVGSVTGILVDPVLETLPGAVAGAVIAGVLEKIQHRSDVRHVAV